MFNRRFVVVIIFFCLIISLPAFCNEPNDEPNYVPGELLIRFAPQEKGEYLRSETKQMIVESVCEGTIKDESDFLPGLTLVIIPEDLSVEEAIAAFENTPGILYAQPNFIYHTQSTFPNDPCFPLLWDLNKYSLLDKNS
jgi:hypothetical protein